MKGESLFHLFKIASSVAVFITNLKVWSSKLNNAFFNFHFTIVFFFFIYIYFPCLNCLYYIDNSSMQCYNFPFKFFVIFFSSF